MRIRYTDAERLSIQRQARNKLIAWMKPGDKTLPKLCDHCRLPLTDGSDFRRRPTGAEFTVAVHATWACAAELLITPADVKAFAAEIGYSDATVRRYLGLENIERNLYKALTSPLTG